MVRILVFWVCVFSSSFTDVFSQTAAVVRLSNRAGEYVVGATITLIAERDSTVRWIRVTDTIGIARFPFQAGKFRLNAEAISYRTINKLVTLSSSEEIKFIMEQDASIMQGVVITGRKPLMRQEDDKTIVDPEPIVLGSTSAYEVMEKIPGLFMDQEGNIFLNSTSPSAIWINGREQRMGVAEIAVILKSLPPNAIDRIELI